MEHHHFSIFFAQVMLMLRRLHSDLSEGGGSPRHGGYRAAPGAAGAAGPGEAGGGIIDSALTPLSGAWMRAIPGTEGLWMAIFMVISWF